MYARARSMTKCTPDTKYNETDFLNNAPRIQDARERTNWKLEAKLQVNCKRYGSKIANMFQPFSLSLSPFYSVSKSISFAYFLH